MSQLNNLEDMSQIQRSVHVTHRPMLVTMCAKYGRNSSRMVSAVELTGQDVPYLAVLLQSYG